MSDKAPAPEPALEPVAAAEASLNDDQAATPGPALEPVAAAGAPLKVADNPLRKQTLLGVGPHGAAREAIEPTASAATTTPAVVSDAPTTLELGRGAQEPKTVERSSPSASSPSSPASDDLELPKPRSRSAMWLAGAAVAAIVGIVLVSGQRTAEAPPTAPRAAAAEPVAAPREAEPAPDTAPAVVAVPESSPVAAAPSAAPSGGASALIPIRVESDPPGARLFWRGKAVGTTPFVLELHEGEKHAYELGMPGFVTRKVVIDGSQPKMKIGLRPEPAAPPSAKARK